jgi:alkylhydroperoxidase/carboxymuconolactone decarboxylase family protein YurZ
MENQVQLNAERIELLNKFKEAIPQFMAAEAEVIELAYKEGALSSKIKRLIAMAVALKVG